VSEEKEPDRRPAPGGGGHDLAVPEGGAPPRERIVVTGMGAVSPYGLGVKTLLDGVRTGRSTIEPIAEFPVDECRCRLGARIPPLDLSKLDGTSSFRRAPRATQYAIAATDEALRHAAHTPTSWPAERVGVFLGTYRGMTEVSEQIWHKLIESEPRFVPALLFQETVTNAVASAISIRWGLKGTNYAISSGNASGYQVLYLALQALRSGRLDAVVAGAFDVFTSANHHDMDDLGMLSERGASRPFDRRRDGFIMGEGAGVLILERRPTALARGARILAEIGGVGIAHDAYGFATHHPEGRGLATAAGSALTQAGVTPAAIDYIGTAANSTLGLDRAESRAIHTVFGDCARTVPVSSLKALTGEAMAASDLFNLIVCIAAVGGGELPPQAGTDECDPECPLNLVTPDRQPPNVRTVLAHSYSYFGGSAAAVVVGQPVPLEGESGLCQP